MQVYHLVGDSDRCKFTWRPFTGRQVRLYTDKRERYGQMPPVPDGKPLQTSARAAPPAVITVMTLLLSMA